MTADQITELSNKLKVKLPKGVHPKIDEIMNCMSKLSMMLSTDLADPVVRLPLMKIVNRLEANDLKPVQAMKQLTKKEDWCEMFADAIKEGYDVNANLTPDILGNLEVIYRKERGAGKQVKLSLLMQKVQHMSTSKIEQACEFNDITASNIIVTLTDIVADSKEEILDALPQAEELIDEYLYEKIPIHDIAVGTDWALKQIDEGKANRVTIRQYVLDKRKEVERAIELLRMFHPLLKEAHVIVSLMPVLLTMMYGEQSGLEKIREDCNNIFNEFSMGAQLERLTISLNEKIGKKRSLEDIQINRDAIAKNFQKIKDALVFQVISYLRRSQAKTIIEDDVFEDAKKIGIDLTGLRTKFGVEKAPAHYSDIKLDSSPEFAQIINIYSKTMGNRVSEEIGVKIQPNLHSLDGLMGEIKKKIEADYSMIPAHIAPLFAGSIKNLITVIKKINIFMEPFKMSSLILILNDETKKTNFYNSLEQLYNDLRKEYDLYLDFVDLGIKLATADQSIALAVCSRTIEQKDHLDGYPKLFEGSMGKIKRMIGMKTLSKEGAKIFEGKLSKAQNAMQKFIKKYSWTTLNKILDLGIEDQS